MIDWTISLGGLITAGVATANLLAFGGTVLWFQFSLRADTNANTKVIEQTADALKELVSAMRQHEDDDARRFDEIREQMAISYNRFGEMGAALREQVNLESKWSRDHLVRRESFERVIDDLGRRLDKADSKADDVLKIVSAITPGSGRRSS